MEELDRSELYPFLFEPAYKEVLWGGNKFRTVIGRDLPEDTPPLGESWDICDRPNISSTVINGRLAGATLGELLDTYRCDLAGRSYLGGAFPLMVKLLDTGSARMSVHVHPSDEFCAAQNTFCEPKAEMWYVLQADKGARIYAGLKTTATRHKFLDLVREKELLDELQSFDSVPGDAYFLPPGRVHSLGAGNLVLEISRNSDTVYRITDFGREDASGTKRQLHVREAVSCMDFIDRTVPRVCGVSNTSAHNRKYPIINRCPYFHCDSMVLVDDWRDETDVKTGFHILTSVGKAFDVGNDRFTTHVSPYESVLIPACFGSYMIHVQGETDLIRTTL